MTTHHNFKDISGQRFGMLTAIQPSHSDGKRWHWIYSCDCGHVCIKLGQEVSKSQKRGRLPNCGCAVRRIIGEKNTKHGMSRHPAYAVWRSMNDRCRLPTHQAWHNYGARGISVCLQWRSDFAIFWADMGSTYARGLEIDRIENNGNYEPGNCRWVPNLINANNRRGNQTINTPQGPMTVSEASRCFGVGKSTLHYRITHGWPQDQLFKDANFHNRESRGAGVIIEQTKRIGKL